LHYTTKLKIGQIGVKGTGCFTQKCVKGTDLPGFKKFLARCLNILFRSLVLRFLFLTHCLFAPVPAQLAKNIVQFDWLSNCTIFSLRHAPTVAASVFEITPRR